TDILKELGKNKSKQFLVGFALETDDLIKNASKKLKEKNLDLIVANRPKTLEKDRSDFIMIDKRYKRKFLNIPKINIANKILNQTK
ncbi:MAG: phosphopantothenoylcysteine decarboxylase, partial [Nanoarchaeota archaeon]